MALVIVKKCQGDMCLKSKVINTVIESFYGINPFFSLVVTGVVYDVRTVCM
jgi:hypothetical protein